MKNINRHEGTVHILKRLDNSSNGNPQYLLSIDGVTCRTQVDSMHGYEVPNYDNRSVVATIGTHYQHATLNTIAKGAE